MKIWALLMTFAVTSVVAAAETPAAPAVIGETLWLAREASVLADLTPAGAAARLPALLKQHFNVDLTCGKGQLLDPNAPRCLIGARHVARAFYRGLVPALTPEAAEVLTVNITDERYAHISTNETKVRVNLPYATPPAEVVRHVERALKSRALSNRIALLADHRKTLGTWNDLGLIELDFDPGLTLARQRHLLDVLLELAAEDDTLFDRPSEVLYVTTRFSPLFERHLRLEEALRADAPIEEVRRFLNETNFTPRANAVAQARIKALRERIRVAGQELERTLKIKYDCSDQANLTLSGCASTLERLVRFNRRLGGLEVDAKMVLVIDRSEAPNDADVFQSVQDKAPYGILALRNDFNYGYLKRFARGRGWIR